jgi:hypothetical protein
VLDSFCHCDKILEVTILKEDFWFLISEKRWNIIAGSMWRRKPDHITVAEKLREREREKERERERQEC